MSPQYRMKYADQFTTITVLSHDDDHTSLLVTTPTVTLYYHEDEEVRPQVGWVGEPQQLFLQFAREVVLALHQRSPESDLPKALADAVVMIATAEGQRMITPASRLAIYPRVGLTPYDFWQFGRAEFLTLPIALTLPVDLVGWLTQFAVTPQGIGAGPVTLQGGLALMSEDQGQRFAVGFNDDLITVQQEGQLRAKYDRKASQVNDDGFSQVVKQGQDMQVQLQHFFKNRL